MIDITLDTTTVRGLAELEPTSGGLRLHRLPAWVRTQYPEPQLLGVEAQPAGAHIAVRTAASRLELDLHSTHATLRGLARPRGRGRPPAGRGRVGRANHPADGTSRG